MNNSTTKTRLLHAACGPPEIYAMPKIHAKSSRKVMWTRTAVPATEPMVRDQDMTIAPAASVTVSAAAAMTATFRKSRALPPLAGR